MPPVNEIELSSAHTGRKMVLMIVFMAIGVAAFVYGFMQLLRSDESGGWQEISVSSGGELSCGDDFVLLYNLGSSGGSVSAERKGLTAAYSGAAVTAYRLFESGSSFEGVHNVWYINQHPNEAVDVDPALYRALEQIQASGNRSLYLGPVYEVYDGVFSCENDGQTADFDPRQNDQLRDYFARCAAYAADASAVRVELLGNGEIRLNVSEEYMAFAREEEITRFIDFDWMKNAFIADYLAQKLTEQGYTNGALNSYDGFVRNLYAGEEPFGLNVFERGAPAGVMTYTEPMSIVYLRSYPMSELDRQHYYALPDGRVCSSHVDPADGLCREAVDDLLAYTSAGDCAGTLLALAPVYVSDALDSGALSELAESGIFSVLCQDGQIRYNDSALTVTAEEGYAASYTGN